MRSFRAKKGLSGSRFAPRLLLAQAKGACGETRGVKLNRQPKLTGHRKRHRFAVVTTAFLISGGRAPATLGRLPETLPAAHSARIARHAAIPNQPAAPARAARIARHTRSGVAGISMWRTPSSLSASTIALMTAASAGVVPPSPPERTPRRFVGDGTSLSAVFISGKVSARGIA